MDRDVRPVCKHGPSGGLAGMVDLFCAEQEPLLLGRDAFGGLDPQLDGQHRVC